MGSCSENKSPCSHPANFAELSLDIFMVQTSKTFIPTTRFITSKVIPKLSSDLQVSPLKQCQVRDDETTDL